MVINVKKILVSVLLVLVQLSVSAAVRADDIGLGFTGISLDVKGQAGGDYVVERLWYDGASDDDVIIYIKSDTPIALGHNRQNIVGAATEWQEGMDPGTIVYKIDGDGLRKYADNSRVNKYHAVAAYGKKTPPPLNEIQFQYSEPFTLGKFKGKVGPTKLYHQGIKGPFGDEWHALTFWDVDPKNTKHKRDDQANDGKVVLLVVDPQTPAIRFSVGQDGDPSEQYYTTSAKNYYAPHIFKQKTYLTGGVSIRLANITNDEPIYYQVGDGPAKKYSGSLMAHALFEHGRDAVHRLTYWIGESGPKKVRLVHYLPSQPGQQEQHPRLLYPNYDALVADREKLAKGGVDAATVLNPGKYIQMRSVNFRTGVRYIHQNFFRGGYFYQTKGIAALIMENARLGLLKEDNAKLRTAVDGLLFLFTIDPIGAESFDGRAGGPCQERAMYSDGRVLIDAAVAYDLIAGFTRENGYDNGMSPIEHIKIRDNLAGEACMMMKYPTSIPQPFWTTKRPAGSTRNVQLEMFIASLALAMPTYDSPYYGTSGADGKTKASHLWAPLEDAALSWIEVHEKGYVEHPSDPKRFRYSELWNLFGKDGTYVGQPRDGYLGMMHRDVISFLNYRLNFDGHHYERFEKYLRMRMLQRYPFNGVVMPQAFFEGGYSSPDRFLGKLVRKDFVDAPYYRWALEHPVKLDKVNLADPTIEAKPLPFNSYVGESFAVLSSDLSDPKAVMMRMRVFPSGYNCVSGTFQTYLGGAINVCGYGERLVIEKAGYHRDLDNSGGYGGPDYGLGTSQRRKSVILVENRNDDSANMVRGKFSRGLVSPGLDYAEMQGDLDGTSDFSIYKALEVDLTRRVFFVDKKFFILVDTLSSAKGPQKYDWLLHGSTGGEKGAFVQDNQKRTALWTKPSGVRLFTQMLTAAEFNESELIENDYIASSKDGIPEPYLQATTRGKKVHYMTVLYPLDKGMAEPEIKMLDVPGAVAAEISGGAGQGRTVIALRTGEAPLQPAEGFNAQSDALLTLLQKSADGVVQTLVVVDGKMAKVEGSALSVKLDAPGVQAVKVESGQVKRYSATAAGND